MANIGQLQEAPSGAFEGRLRTLTVKLKIALEPIAPADKRGAESPDFDAYALTEDGPVPIGSAWKKEVQNGPNRGNKFLSLTLDDPSFPAPLNVAAFPSNGPHWDVVWNRPRQANREAA